MLIGGGSTVGKKTVKRTGAAAFFDHELSI